MFDSGVKANVPPGLLLPFSVGLLDPIDGMVPAGRTNAKIHRLRSVDTSLELSLKKITVLFLYDYVVLK